MINNEPVIGILGGAGPDATIDLQRELSISMKDQLQAVSDQEHLRVITDNFTNMPDRSYALLNHGTSPLKHMVKSALNLENLGCDMLLYPCNTAHAYLPELRNKLSIPILDMIKETCDEIKQKTNPKKIGILCTDVTRKFNLYKIVDTEIIYPDKYLQAQVMQAIFSVKAGYTREKISSEKVIKSINRYLSGLNNFDPNLCDYSISPQEIFFRSIANLLDKGAESVIFGCTEIPLCFDLDEINAIEANIFNPTKILAGKAVRYAKSLTEEHSL